MLAVCRCFERRCIHYQGVHQPDGTEQGEVNVCAAFPPEAVRLNGDVGIPDEIAYGDDLHLDPWPSEEAPQDNGIQFERDYSVSIAGT